MKLKTHLIILLNNGYIILLSIAIMVSIPLQFMVFMMKGKNTILKYLEDKIYKTFFYNNDLKNKIQRINKPYNE